MRIILLSCFALLLSLQAKKPNVLMIAIVVT